MTKRRSDQNITGFVIETSPSPSKNGYLRFKFQTDSNTVKRCICFDKSKNSQLTDLETTGESTTLRSVKTGDTSKNPTFAEVIFDQTSSIEKSAKGNIQFKRMKTGCSLLTVKEVLETSLMNTLVHMRGALLFNPDNVDKRGSTEILECHLKDTTGLIQVTIWGPFIRQVLANPNKIVYLKDVFYRDFKGKRISTTSSTVISFYEPSNEEIDLFLDEEEYTESRYKDLQGVVRFIKGYSMFYLCQSCGKKLTDVLTEDNAKCPTCATIQPTSFCPKSRSVSISIDGILYTAFEDVISALPNENVNENDLAQQLLGKQVHYSFDIKTNVLKCIKLDDTSNPCQMIIEKH